MDISRVREHENILKITGSLNINSIDLEIEKGKECIENAISDLTFDLSEVTDCDSAGVAALVAWTRHAKKHGKLIHFSGVHQFIRDIVRVSWLDSVLSIEP